MIEPPQRTKDILLASNRSRTGSLLGVQVLGIGSSVPEPVVTNEDLAALGFDSAWIVQRTGICQRRHVPPGQATSHLAVEAAQRCIAQAGVDPELIDLVLVATVTPDVPMPATASLVQDRLGLSALAFDVSAACAGFVIGMLTGMQFVATGCSRLALVIGADCHSRVVNPADRQTYPLFGDGAGAVLLGPGDVDQGLVAYAVGSDGSGANVLHRTMGGSHLPYAAEDDLRRYLYMDGRPVFKWAVRMLEETIRDVLQVANLTVDDLDLVVLHQANQRILDAAASSLGLPRSLVYSNLDRYGNTGAASIPLALDEAWREGRVERGDQILLSGFGGGLAWGTAVLRW